MATATVLTTEKTNDTRSPSIEAAIEAILTKKRLKEKLLHGKRVANKQEKKRKVAGYHNQCCQIKSNYFCQSWHTAIASNIQFHEKLEF